MLILISRTFIYIYHTQPMAEALINVLDPNLFVSFFISSVTLKSSNVYSLFSLAIVKPNMWL